MRLAEDNSFNDKNLIKMTLRGNNAGFAHLYRKYYPKIYRQALTLIGDPDECLDMTQDIFIKIYDHLASFKGESSFSTWIYAITRNHCLEVIRKKQNGTTESLMDHLNLFHHTSDPEYEDNYEFKKDLVETKLSDAYSECPDILYLKYKLNMSIQEIMHQLNLSESAVKMRLMRARKKLVRILELRESAA